MSTIKKTMEMGALPNPWGIQPDSFNHPQSLKLTLAWVFAWVFCSATPYVRAETPTPESHIPASSEMTASQLDYMVGTYIQTPSWQPYRLVYGHPEKANTVVVVWTSLGCPSCNEMHHNALTALKDWANTRSDFALIVRDYAMNPISIKGSSMVWSCQPNDIEKILVSLHDQQDWHGESLESLDMVQKTIDRLSPESSAAAQKALLNKDIWQKVFESRKADKAALSLTQVPTVVILRKKANQWVGKRMDDPIPQALKKAMERTLKPYLPHKTPGKP